MTNIEIVRSPHAPNAKMPVFGVSGVGCADAEPAQPPPMDATVKAWTAAPPLPYRDDTNPPPHWFWGDIYKRMKRRPRCGAMGGNDGR